MPVPGSAADKEGKERPREPERRELWVPSKALEEVLRKHPNAVLLTRAQYDALVRDAGKLSPDGSLPPPPVGAIVESLRLNGVAKAGRSVLALKGEMVVRVLAKGWASAAIELPWPVLGRLESAGGVLLENQPAAKDKPSESSSSLMILAKGPGEHRIRFESSATVGRGSSPDERLLFYRQTRAPALLELELPAGSTIAQGPPGDASGDKHLFFIGGQAGGQSVIAWRQPPPAGLPARLSGLGLRGNCRFGESEVTATYDALLSSSATDAPARELVLQVSPPQASVVAVEGGQLESWSQDGSALTVRFAMESRSLQLRIELRQPLVLPEKEATPIEIPAVRLGGAQPSPAVVEVMTDEGVELLELRASRSPMAHIAEWDTGTAKAVALIRKAVPRLTVDADARIFVGRDEVGIERTVNVTTDRPADHLEMTIPAEEELLGVEWSAGPGFEWRRSGRVIDVEWSPALDARNSGRLLVRSRIKLPARAAASAGGPATHGVTVTNLAVEGANKLSGYVALDGEPSWQLTASETGGLEDRDARLTPVKGRMAWFNLREFRLTFEARRRQSSVDAEVTAYALPRASSVEIEGQVSLDIAGAPLRQVEVRITRETARLLRFTSPLIGEQSLDENTGVWRLSLARESVGRLNLRFRMALPGTAGAAAAAGQATLNALLPRIEIPSARRFRGSWVVEANTDTELSFDTSSLQPVDVMRVPAVEGYSPRHRLVAAFAYGTGEHRLAITATRHAHSELAALIVSQLRLTSVLSRDGTSRHEASIRLQHSGEQFVPIGLPAGSQLLVALVEGKAVKPVRAAGSAVAIPLPGGPANGGSVSVRVMCEQTGEPWAATGSRDIEPIQVLGKAPILATEWTVHAPEGFSYRTVDTGMEQRGAQETGITGRESFAFGERLLPEAAAASPLERARRPKMNEVLADAAANQSAGAAKLGLLPLQLDLPTSGRVLQFTGSQAPETLILRYVSWERQMAWAMALMAMGGLIFVAWGSRRPWLRTLLVGVLLSAGVRLVAGEWLPLVNAALFGWLVALGVWVVWRVLAGIEHRRQAAAAARATGAAAMTVLLAGFSVVSLSSAADTTPPAADPAAHTVIVPYDIGKPFNPQNASRYYLDRDTFERLWKLAKENRKPDLPEDATDKPAAALHSAMYRVVIEEQRLVVEAQFEVGTRGRWAKLPLAVKAEGPVPAVARDWRVDGSRAVVADDGVVLEQPGRHVVEVVFEQKRAGGWKDSKLSLPRAAAALVSVVAPETDGAPEVESAGLMTEESSGGQRLFTAALGDPASLAIRRHPKRPLDNERLPAVADASLIVGHTLGGAESIFGEVRFQFPGTERSRFAVAVDTDVQVASWTVRGNGADLAVRSWASREEQGRRVIEFELNASIADESQVRVWGSRKVEGASLRTPWIAGKAAKGEQTIALLHDETVQLRIEPAPGARRIGKPADFNPTMIGARGEVASIFYRLPAGQSLAYTRQPAELNWEARTDYVFQLGDQKQEIMAAMALRRTLDAWSQLRIGLPAGFEIQSVTGPSLAAWKQDAGDLFVQFDPSASGTEARLIVHLAKSEAQPQTEWAIAPLELPGFRKSVGSALIVAHAAVEVRLPDSSGNRDLAEVDPQSVTDVFGIAPPLEKKRAVRFERGGWTARVAIARQAARFSADGVVLAQLTDQGLFLSQQVGIYVERGALNRVTIQLPATLPEAVVKGPALREVRTNVTDGMRAYDCSFQGEVLTRTALTLEMELPPGDELNLPFVEVANAARLRRFFVLDNASKLESRVLVASGVESTTRSALPYIPDGLAQPSFYRGRAGSGEIRVGFRQFQSTGGNAAIVTLADITSVWRADGERWDTVVYSIFNRSLQFLPVVLPGAAELVAVMVSGEAVRADELRRADGTRVRLIPLIETRSGQRSLEVTLIYRLPKPAWESHATRTMVRMDDPELVGIPAERTVWTAIVPRRFAIARVDGNMEEVAEESRVLEKLQGYMADLGRINRALSSFYSYEGAESASAFREAGKLMKQIEDETRMVDSRRKDKAAILKGAKPAFTIDAREDREAALQLQVAEDLGRVQQELAKQQDVLTENLRAAGAQTGRPDPRRLSEPSWSFNEPAAQQGRRIDGLGQAGPAVSARGAGRVIALNDHVVLTRDFLTQPGPSKGEPVGSAGLTTLPAIAAGSGAVPLSGAPGVVVAGGATLVLDGAGTFAGAPLIGRHGAPGMRGATEAPDDRPAAVPGKVLAGNARANAVTLAPAQTAAATDSFAYAQVPAPSAPESRTAARADANAAKPEAGPAAEQFGLEAQVSSQLRVTGRRSLMIDVPADGTAYHFRKLKDHAVLELKLRRAWTDDQRRAASWLGAGLGAYLLGVIVARRRRRASPARS